MAQLELAQGERVLFAYLTGEIDHHAAALLRRQLDDGVFGASPQLLVFDLGGVTFMDSSGVGLILGRLRLMEALGGKVRVQNALASTRKMLQLSGLGQLVEIVEGERV